MNKHLELVWNLRCKLVNEGNAVVSKGDKFWIEGNAVINESKKLRNAANKIFDKDKNLWDRNNGKVIITDAESLDVKSKDIDIINEGIEIRAEGERLISEGHKIQSEGINLRNLGNKIWNEAIIQVYGNIKIELKYISEKDDDEFKLENGEIYSP